jgi:hypothetical protein
VVSAMPTSVGRSLTASAAKRARVVAPWGVMRGQYHQARRRLGGSQRSQTGGMTVLS